MSGTVVSLGDICEFKYGKALPATARDGGAYAVFGSNGIVGCHSAALTQGATIVIGRKGSLGELNYSDAPCWPIDTTYYVDEASTNVDLRWLFHAMHSLGLTELNRAAAVPGLNRNDAYAKRMLLPPREEQRRIAAILDKADALRAKRREAIAKLDQLLQSVFLDMFGDPATNPKGWPLVRFTDVGEWKSGATPTKDVAAYWDGPIPWVSPKDMKVSAISDAKDHVSEHAFQATGLKRIEAGHLLIVVRGMILAHSFPTAINLVPIAINQDMKAIQPSNEFEVVYLKAAVDALKERVLSAVSTAGHGTRRLSTLDASEVLIPLAPKELQRKFAQAVTVFVEGRDRARRQIDGMNQLFASLQARAFSGAL